MPRVVCPAEKPIATSVAETVEAINACNEAGVQLMTALQRRFDPNFLRVKQAVKSGEIGEVVTVKLCSRDPAPPPAPRSPRPLIPRDTAGCTVAPDDYWAKLDSKYFRLNQMDPNTSK